MRQGSKRHRTKREGSAGKKSARKNIILKGSAILIGISILTICITTAMNQTPLITYIPTEKAEIYGEEIRVLNGERYVPKKNIETYLFMGIDDSGKVRERMEYDGTGQCDVLILFVRDISEGTYMTLPINRNTMMDVDSIDIDGTYLATTENQIALAHSDGNGLEMSCENVVKAVSNYFDGQHINGYAAVNMGAISIINHLIGGVTVTIEDDFSNIDSTLVMGETITLNDEQAVTFVRGRREVADGSNTNRMKRQSEYLKLAEIKIRDRCNSDSQFPLTIYEALEEYMVTDISDQKFSKIALLAAKDKSSGSLQLEGETIVGEMDFEEFRADQTSLEQVMAQLFYRKYE